MQLMKAFVNLFKKNICSGNAIIRNTLPEECNICFDLGKPCQQAKHKFKLGNMDTETKWFYNCIDNIKDEPRFNMTNIKDLTKKNETVLSKIIFYF